MLRRLYGFLRNRMEVGREGVLLLQEIREALGRRAGDEEATAALHALARCGSVELQEKGTDGGSRSGRGSSWGGIRKDAVRLTLLPGTLGLASLSRRRKAEEAQLRSILRYAKGGMCRRNSILAYFGEAFPSSVCGRCDRCRSGPGGKVVDGKG